jgi:hypothetical protein
MTHRHVKTAFPGWEIEHYDPRRDVYTLYPDRWWKPGYLIVPGEKLRQEVVTVVERQISRDWHWPERRVTT